MDVASIVPRRQERFVHLPPSYRGLGCFRRAALPHRGHFIRFSAASAAVTEPPRGFSLPRHTATRPAAVHCTGREQPQLRPRVKPSSAEWCVRLHPRPCPGSLIGRFLGIIGSSGLHWTACRSAHNFRRAIFPQVLLFRKASLRRKSLQKSNRPQLPPDILRNCGLRPFSPQMGTSTV